MRFLAIAFAILVGALSTAHSLKSTRLLRRDPAKHYPLLRATYERLIQEMITEASQPLPEDFPGKSGTLIFCAAGDWEIFSDDGKTWEFAMLAYEYVQTAVSLKMLGYPEEVWKPDLTEYEQKQSRYIARHNGRSTKIAEEYMQQLWDKLNAHQKVNSNLMALEAIAWQYGCGDYTMSIMVVTRPRGARVLMIPYGLHPVPKTPS